MELHARHYPLVKPNGDIRWRNMSEVPGKGPGCGRPCAVLRRRKAGSEALGRAGSGRFTLRSWGLRRSGLVDGNGSSETKSAPKSASRIVALAGGIGAARFLRGLLVALKSDSPSATVTVIGNTGDDITLFGLRVCPDLDTVMYTLGGGINEEQGWGRADETFGVQQELGAYSAAVDRAVGEVGPQWFGLGDRDIATHVLRTQWLAEGVSLSEVTRRLCERWLPGVHLLPMSNDTVETHVVLDDPVEGSRTVHFQEWWVRLHAAVPAHSITAMGADRAQPGPGVIEAIAAADVIVFPPSNPVVSIGTILAVPGIRDALVNAPAPIVGVSPIVGGAPVRGMADACLQAIGVETSARAVAEHYGPQLLDGWLVDDVDADSTRPPIDGIVMRSRPLLMTDIEATAAIARAALELAADLQP
jgi:LPPG:FO 2-phospho-L-lactate transferase